ncbi:MAG TPA: hypothetical protein VGI92_00010 [Gemmatimonadales bacterium]
MVAPETLAALLDGTLPPDERARVLAIIARSPEAYEGFAEAAAVHRQVNAVPGGRRVSWRTALPLLAAAAVGVVLLVPRWIAARGTADVVTLVQAADLELGRGPDAVGRRLGATWSEAGWSVLRGAESPLSERARAVRAGVRVADIEACVTSGDSLALTGVRSELVRLVRDSPLAAALAVQYATLGLGSTLAERRELNGQLRTLLGSPGSMELGAWLETARLAGLANRREFFATNGAGLPSLRQIRRAIGTLPADAMATSLIQDVDALVDGMSSGRFAASPLLTDSLTRIALAHAAD